ncbi:oxysterol binding protein [Moniliophthora roreri MCA 2997]|uniref:Oxysterol binding protein n=1 Tax=Moniliophthora roreri (strain MCA 2997) TaxID=1381753 RepID=V2XZY7_MONRO|nr:oxysterol binding protein [Moniliophthora roreri MCA 2997]
MHHKPHAYAAARASLSHGFAISAPSNQTAASVVIQEGWVLKKRRKKMQGFARRYFVLYQSGLLTYSFEPGQPVRDQILLQTAAISTAPGRKDIHIDSSSATFHMKCLSTDDFACWMLAFRKFIAPTPEARRSASIRPSRQGSLKLNKSALVVEDMGTTLVELEDAFNEFLDSYSKRNHSIGRSRSEKDKNKDSSSVFGLFKKTHHHAPVEEGQRLDASQHSEPDLTSEQRVRQALESLKTQHMFLMKSIHGLSPLETSVTHSGHPSPLPHTVEEEEHDQDQDHHEEDLAKFSLPFTRTSKRASLESTMTDSFVEWYDASEGHEGAEVFVLDDSTPETEQPSRITNDDDIRSSFAQNDDRSSLDTDIASLDEKSSSKAGHTTQATTYESSQIVRRTTLPAPITGDEGSLFAVLKKNVGKDLSTIAFPVTFNEPLTLLQRAAEELEYYDLLNQAGKESDPIKRMHLVAAFAVSSYAHTRHRTGRKGFNPMLAETFEDTRMKFIAEKVRHNPVEMAYHAEGANWELTATSAGKTKFWGKSLEVIPLGTTHLQIGDDHYQWKKPSSFMRNLMVGTKYLEHVGKMVIENTTDNSRCVLEFKQSSYWGASNIVSGVVHNSSGDMVSKLEGKWDEQFSHEIDSSHFVILWRATPWPKNMHEYYGFTSFSITLNEITSDIAGKLPPTDSRLRPDVRALEEGDLDTAEAEKNRVEEAQRDRRKRGAEPKPRWFKQQGEEWVYAGGYWEARGRGWKGVDVKPLW